MYETIYRQGLMLSAPLDTAGVVFIFGNNYNSLLNARKSNLLVDEIFKNYYYSTEGKMSTFTTTVLCDVEAANLIFNSDYLSFTDYPITVNDDGYTVIDYVNGNLVKLALSWTSLFSFDTHVTERLLTWENNN